MTKCFSTNEFVLFVLSMLYAPPLFVEDIPPETGRLSQPALSSRM